jgi:putative (di)nucleoside polyphosphate hydrolase
MMDTVPTHTPEPKPGYRPGVGVMLVNDQSFVLVARRIDMPSEAWQMPQGGIDAGEAPAAAARRELREEIGTDRAEILAESRGWLNYDLPAELIAVLWGGRYRGQSQKWFLARFTGRDEDIDLETEHPEFLAWRWAPLDDLPDLIVPFKRQLYLDILAEFRPVLSRLRR